MAQPLCETMLMMVEPIAGGTHFHLLPVPSCFIPCPFLFNIPFVSFPSLLLSLPFPFLVFTVLSVYFLLLCFLLPFLSSPFLSFPILSLSSPFSSLFLSFPSLLLSSPSLPIPLPFSSLFSLSHSPKNSVAACTIYGALCLSFFFPFLHFSFPSPSFPFWLNTSLERWLAPSNVMLAAFRAKKCQSGFSQNGM